jgi:hypothetical protein
MGAFQKKKKKTLARGDSISYKFKIKMKSLFFLIIVYFSLFLII